MRVAVTGAGGQLGTQLVRALTLRHIRVVSLTRPDFDLAAPERLPQVDLVINAAAWTDVDGCTRDPERAMALNGAGPGLLAEIAYRRSIGFMQISTNEVFDGASQRAYAESDTPNPINAYGASKLAGEKSVAAAHPDATIIRTSWIYGGPRSFPAKILRAARERAEDGRPLAVVVDEVGNPTPAPLLAERIADLVMRPSAPPIIHVAGTPPVSRHAWACLVLARAGLPDPAPISLSDYQRASAPPPHAVLETRFAESLGIVPIEWQIHMPESGSIGAAGASG